MHLSVQVPCRRCARTSQNAVNAKFGESSIVFDEVGTVVATDRVSANVDYDNGAKVRG
jgi:hypothetical protein